MSTALTDVQIKKVSNFIAAYWQDVGYALGLQHTVVRRINRDQFFPELSDKAAEMLFAVKQKNGRLFLEDLLGKLREMEKVYDAKLIQEAMATKPKVETCAELHLPSLTDPQPMEQPIQDTHSPTPDGVLLPEAYMFASGISGLLKESRRKVKSQNPVLERFLPPKTNGSQDVTDAAVQEEGLAGSPFDLAEMTKFFRFKIKVKIYKNFIGLATPSIEDKKQIISVIQRLINSPRNAKLIYFSGHGEGTAGNWQLGNNLEISFDEVFEMWKNRDQHKDVSGFDREKEKLVIISDSCYSGHWVHKVMEKRKNGDVDAKQFFVQASCWQDETSIDYVDGGMFTKLYARSPGLHNGMSTQGPMTTQENDEEWNVSKVCGHTPCATISDGSTTELVQLSPEIKIGLVKGYWITLKRDVAIPVQESGNQPPADDSADELHRKFVEGTPV